MCWKRCLVICRRYFQIFRHIKLPGAGEQFFSGLKVSASYAVVGAVISEWLGGFEGLGVYMTRVKKAYAFDKMFAVIILISAVSLLLMAFVALLKFIALPHKRKEIRMNKIMKKVQIFFEYVPWELNPHRWKPTRIKSPLHNRSVRHALSTGGRTRTCKDISNYHSFTSHA